MKFLAIYPTQSCCLTFDTLFSVFRVKKQLLLLLAFLFSIALLNAQAPGFGPCANNNDDAPPYSVANSMDPNFIPSGSTFPPVLEISAANITPGGEDFCIGNDPGVDTIDGCGTFLFTDFENLSQPDCPIQICFTPKQGCGNALGNVCVWIEDPNSPGDWLNLGQPTSGNGEVCVLLDPGITQYALTVCRPGNGPVSIQDVEINYPPTLTLAGDVEICDIFLPETIDLTQCEIPNTTGGVWRDPSNNVVPDPTSVQINGNIGDEFIYSYTYDFTSTQGYNCTLTEDKKVTILGNCCDNPINPAPSCNALDVIVVLDESGSIGSSTATQVETATLALADALIGTGANMAIVEFATNSSIPTYGSYSGWTEVTQDYYDDLAANLPGSYGDGGWTNWEAALRDVLTLNDIMTADIVLFMTDGSPTRSLNNAGNVTSNGNHLNKSLDEACEVKLDGSHIFMLGIGSVDEDNLVAVSGPIPDDGPGDPTLTPLTADYGLITAGDLSACFLDIAQNGCTNDLKIEKKVYAGHGDSGAGCAAANDTVESPNDYKVTYCFTVINDGDQTLSNLMFNDLDINIDETDLTPAWQTSLTSGSSATYYYEATLPGNTVFPFENTASVTGETPTGDPLSDDDMAEVTEPTCLPPQITCPSDTQIECDESSDPSNTGSATSIEGCGDVTITFNDVITQGNCAGNYTITRTWTATDENQDTATCDQIITVSDTTDPILSGIGTDGTFECGGSPSFATPTATDNCDNSVTIIFQDTLGDSTCAGSAIIRTWTAIDDCGNTATASRTMTPVDNTPPTLDEPSPIANINCNDPLPTQETLNAQDCSAVTVTPSVDPFTPDVCNGYQITYRWTAVDACGNQSSKTATFNVLPDTQAPVLDEPSAIGDIACNAQLPVQQTLNATDDCSAVTVTPSVDPFTPDVCGGYAITYRWTAVDACGNQSSKTTTFNVLPDTQAPVLDEPSAIGDIVCNAQLPVQQTLNATDDCSAVTVTPSVDPFTPDVCGGYAITYRWTAVDACGNQSSKTTTFNVLPDTQAPVLDEPSAIGDIVCNAQLPVQQTLNATDDCSAVTVTPSVDPFTPDVCNGYQITYRWTAVDACGNQSSKTATFNVLPDTQAPVLDEPSAIGDIACNAQLPVQQTLNATDDCSTVTVTPSVDPFTPDVCNGYQITYRWTAVDACGNQSSKTATFNVLPDTQAPVLDEPSAIGDIACNAQLPVQQTLNATDDCSAVTVTPSVDPFTPDVCNGYQITYRWTAVDACGNQSSKTATFNVLPDTQAPVLDEPSAIGDIACNAQLPVQQTLNATDDCSAVTVTPSVDPFTPDVCGGYAITYRWTAVDACGNQSSKTASFNVLATPTLILNDVMPETYASCDFASQDELNAAFQNFLNKFGYNGGCDASGQFATAYSAPDLCTGGEVEVTYNVTDLCESPSETALFSVSASPALEVSCPTPGVNLDSSSTEQEIKDAYDAWKAGFTKSGGCNATDNLASFPLLPDFDCGTEVDLSFTYTATDRCNPNGVSCSSTFFVPGVTGLTVDCPAAVDLDACTSAVDIELAYEAWKAGFAVNDGDNPTSNIADIPALPEYKCGEPINLSFTLIASDDCNPFPPGVSCTSTFKVQAADALTLSIAPTDVTTLACEDPADKFAQWISDLESMTASGGCNPFLEYDKVLSELSVDGYCNAEAQVVTVMINAADACGATQPVTATFTVPAYSDDLELVGSCPVENEVDGCSTDAEISATFEAWKTALLSNFSATGGCNAVLVYSQDVANLQAPTQCNTTDQVISVNVLAEDDCSKTAATTCTFTVKAFVSTLELNEVTDDTVLSCDYEDQASLDAAFTAFLGEFGFTDGCNATGQFADSYSAPDLCLGGTIEVTYNVSDLCEVKSEMASFTVTPSPVLEVSCSDDVDLSSSATEQEIKDAYDEWKDGFTKSGGCNATDNLDIFPELPNSECGSAISLSFTYTATDRCNENGVSCTSTFDVEGSEPLDAGSNNSDEFCGVQTGIDLFSYLDDGVDQSGGWSIDASTSALNISDPSDVDFPDTGAGSFTLRYTLSSDNGICPDDFMILEIAQDNEVDAGNDNGDEFCGVQTGIDLFSYLDDGVDQNGGWTVVASTSALDISDASDVDFPDTGAGSFTLRYTLSSELGICEDDFMELEIVQDNEVDAGNDNSDEFCGVQTGIDLFSYLDSGVDQNGGWTVIASTSSLDISDASDVDFPDTGAGSFTLRYTLSSELGICEDDFMELEITQEAEVDAGENGVLTICENGAVTAEELFNALGGDPDDNGTWSPEPTGAGVYTYTVEGIEPCPDDSATVTVEELILEISASEPVCDDDYGTYSVAIQVSTGTVTSSLGTPVDNGGGSWTIIDIPTDEDIVATVESIVSNDVQCSQSIDVLSPNCICIELDFDYTDVTCFEQADGTIIVNSVTEGATVTVNGNPYDANTTYGPGDYLVRAFFEGNDDERCIIEQLITIIEPGEVDIDVEHTDVTCFGENDGTITISGLDSYEYYTIKKNGIGPDLSGQTFFEPGIYVVEAFANPVIAQNYNLNGNNARVADPCLDTVIVRILEPEELSCSIYSPKLDYYALCGIEKANSLSVNVAGGTEGYTYFWEIEEDTDSWSIVSDPTLQSIYFSAGGIGICNFTVTITDANGCETSCTYALKSKCRDGGSNQNTNGWNFSRLSNTISLYPNPVKDNLNIGFSQLPKTEVTVEIFDLVGTVAHKKNYNNINEKGINIDFSRFTSNVYYVKITTGKDSIIKKVILDR